jgi:hypothetical protein
LCQRRTPSIGSYDHLINPEHSWRLGNVWNSHDREAVNEDGGDINDEPERDATDCICSDYEPSLGSYDRLINQEYAWSPGDVWASRKATVP